MTTLRVSITNEHGEVYAITTATTDAAGRWWLEDEEGDLETPAGMLDAARRWAEAEAARRGADR